MNLAALKITDVRNIECYSARTKLGIFNSLILNN